MPAADYRAQLDHWCDLLKRECVPATQLPVVAIVAPPDDVDGPCGLWFCPTITLADALVILRGALAKLEPMVNS